jgi:hypothetical protein
MQEPKLLPLRRAIAQMSRDTFTVAKVSLEQCTEPQRRLVAAFVFGMVFTIGQINQLSPSDIHALTIAYLLDVFRYSQKDAVVLADDLIAAASNKNHHPTMNAIIHRGIDGHEQWQNGEMDKLQGNVEAIFEAVQQGDRNK